MSDRKSSVSRCGETLQTQPDPQASGKKLIIPQKKKKQILKLGFKLKAPLSLVHLVPGEGCSADEGAGSGSRSDQHHPAAPGSGTSLWSQSAASSGSPDAVLSDWSVCFLINHQGADPSCCNSDGRHALAIAVVNGHHDVLPVLVQRGADVDQRSGQ